MIRAHDAERKPGASEKCFVCGIVNFVLAGPTGFFVQKGSCQ
jgi:hypothetical protein